MALQPLPKKLPKTLTVTVRLSEVAKENLATLAEYLNMSHGDVMERLLDREVTDLVKEKKLKLKGR